MKKIIDEYKSCDAPDNGFYSASDEYWIIRPNHEWEHDSNREWLCVGGPGVDGIEFGYLKGKSGIYAYYPIVDEYSFLADSADELIKGWIESRITV